MPAPLPVFPSTLMRERSVMYELIGQTISGGQSVSGVMPVTRLDGGGVWKAVLSEVQLRTRDQVLTWRAMTNLCDGGAQPIVLPICNSRYAPTSVVDGARVIGRTVPYSDGSTHSDGTEFQQGLITAHTGGPAFLRSTTLDITIVQGGDLQGGELFSIEHPVMSHRLYRISSALPLGDGVSWRLNIRPPLREAVAALENIEFDHPKCVMRLATPNAMDLMLEQRKWGNAEASFIEAFPPFPE